MLNNYLDIRSRVRLYESFSLDVGSFKILAPYVKKKNKTLIIRPLVSKFLLFNKIFIYFPFS